MVQQIACIMRTQKEKSKREKKVWKELNELDYSFAINAAGEARQRNRVYDLG